MTPPPSPGLLSRSGNLREHGCFHARGAGILGSRLSAEKTTAVSGAGAPFSGMEQRTTRGGGGSVSKGVCARWPCGEQLPCCIPNTTCWYA